MEISNSHTVIEQQRLFFATQTTKSVRYRITLLKKLKKMLIDYEADILNALFQDLGKPPFEAYLSEIYPCLQEINILLKNLTCLTQAHPVKTPWPLWPIKSYVQAEPFGIVLIISPWNFPVQLLILPLIGALAAGNCAILKPSEHAPYTSNLIQLLIEKVFERSIVAVVPGGIPETEKLLQEKFDYIFFTGSPQVGRIIMQAAAQHLTPFTLELGGQNPCIVDKNVTISITAKRITWAKFYNAGQNCLAPNYLLIHKEVKKDFIAAMRNYIHSWYNPGYARIINENHFERLSAFLQKGTIIVGGKTDRAQLYIEPTIIDVSQTNNVLITEEIFGPILPILTYQHIDEALAIINTQPKPLALYLFSTDKIVQQKITSETSSGSIGINDLLLQGINLNLPFGGVGLSGFGAYHGKYSFKTFSHYKSIIKNSLFCDNKFRYRPYTYMHTLYKRFLSFFI